MLRWTDALYRAVEARASSLGARRALSTFFLITFATLLVLVEAERFGLLAGTLPEAWLEQVPRSHLHVIEVLFDLILAYEVVEMVLGLGQSLSGAVGRQFVLFALILLRRSFESLAELQEPIHWGNETMTAIGHLTADAFGGLVVFALVGLYYRTLARRPLTQDPTAQSRFVSLKRVLALGLLGLFVVMAVQSFSEAGLEGGARFYESVFTAFIFGDVVLVLITLRFTSSYHVLFRNTAFGVCGVLLRLALSAPSPFDALLGVVAALFGLGVVATYVRVAPVMESASPESIGSARADRDHAG